MFYRRYEFYLSCYSFLLFLVAHLVSSESKIANSSTCKSNIVIESFLYPPIQLLSGNLTSNVKKTVHAGTDIKNCVDSCCQWEKCHIAIHSNATCFNVSSFTYLTYKSVTHIPILIFISLGTL